MSDDFTQAIRQHGDKELPVEDQAKLGKTQGTSLGDEHAGFLDLVMKLIDDGVIDLSDPTSFIKLDIYEECDDAMKGKIDQATPNIISFLDKIIRLHASDEPSESFEMKGLIEALWQAKERIEKDVDVFVF